MQHRPQTSSRRGDGGYSLQSQRPLHIFIFLLPLMLTYEVGSRFYLNDPAASSVQTIRAHSVLLGFFQDFGVVGRFLPAIALATVLLAWHSSSRDKWRIRPPVLLGMVGESLVLTAPLIVFLALVQLAVKGTPPPPPAAQTDTVEAFAKLPWRAALTISLGAGLYEELLFRLIGVSALRLIFIELAKMTQKIGTGLAVVLCAAAFAAYHDVIGPRGELDVVRGGSLLLAGVYFGTVFVTRGFGIAVGVHVIYDVCVLIYAKPQG